MFNCSRPFNVPEQIAVAGFLTIISDGMRGSWSIGLVKKREPWRHGNQLLEEGVERSGG